MRNWIEYWMIFHSIILLLSTFLFWSTQQLYFLIGAASFSFLSYFIINGIQSKWFSFIFEPANVVSTLRLGILFFILIYHSSISHWAIAILCSLFLIADGLDGYLARRFKTESDFGAYLDMETDAFYVLSLCSLVYHYSLLGSWIFGIGLLRYIYFLVILFFKTPIQKEQRAFRAQLIAVILMISLIICFITPPFIYTPIMIIAAILITYSFSASFWFVIRHQR